MNAYEHPITFTATGDVRGDFRHAWQDYDVNVRSLLRAEKTEPILDVGCGWG